MGSSAILEFLRANFGVSYSDEELELRLYIDDDSPEWFVDKQRKALILEHVDARALAALVDSGLVQNTNQYTEGYFGMREEYYKSLLEVMASNVPYSRCRPKVEHMRVLLERGADPEYCGEGSDGYDYNLLHKVLWDEIHGGQPGAEKNIEAGLLLLQYRAHSVGDIDEYVSNRAPDEPVLKELDRRFRYRWNPWEAIRHDVLFMRPICAFWMKITAERVHAAPDRAAFEEECSVLFSPP